MFERAKKLHQNRTLSTRAPARLGDGHPYTTRRAVNRWSSQGLMREHTAKGPKGRPFKVLTLSQQGAKKHSG